jgi:hypothetical protein
MSLLLCRPVVASAEAVKLVECPKSVQKTIERELEDGRLAEIEALARDDGTLYEADIVVDGREYELHVRANGVLVHKLLERAAGEGAEAVADSNEDAGNGENDSDAADDSQRDEETEADDDKDNADDDRKGDDDDADDKDDDSDKDRKEGKRRSNDMDDDEEDADDEAGDDNDDESANEKDGDATVRLADLPKAVRKTLKLESRGGDIEELERESHKGRVVYAAEVEFETDSGERVYDIEIDRHGVLLSKVLEADEDEEDGDEDE